MNTTLLTQDTVVGYLRDAGLFSGDERPVVTVLGGGVSNIVLLVATTERRVVLKQSLPQLLVADTWLAKTERTLNEAHAMVLVRDLTPQAVPQVLHIDAERCAMVISAAPPDWRDWKQQLMAGVTDAQVATQLGELLGSWHTQISVQGIQGAGLDDPQAFDQLRIDPYYRASAQANPAYAQVMLHAADELTSVRRSLVHGDFSPKNVLVGAIGSPWVIDFEVAHLGNPVFDVAFLLSHLLMKSVHLPGSTHALTVAAQQFWSAYRARAGDAFLNESQVCRHVACLLVARVFGKSPAEYLTSSQQQTVLRAADQVFGQAAPKVAEMWSPQLEGDRA